ncbi:hypothetical protein D3C84_658880 [compost metagenome]
MQLHSHGPPESVNPRHRAQNGPELEVSNQLPTNHKIVQQKQISVLKHFFTCSNVTWYARCVEKQPQSAPPRSGAPPKLPEYFDATWPVSGRN